MPSTDYIDAMVGNAKQTSQGLGECLNGRRRCLLHKYLARTTMLKSKQHQVHRIVQRHHEAGHGRISYGDGLACTNLIHKQWNDGTTRGHHVAVAGRTDDRVVARPRLGHDDLFHHRLADAHGIDGVHGLVGTQAHNALHTCLDSRLQNILGSQDVGFDCLKGVELA